MKEIFKALVSRFLFVKLTYEQRVNFKIDEIEGDIFFPLTKEQVKKIDNGTPVSGKEIINNMIQVIADESCDDISNVYIALIGKMQNRGILQYISELALNAYKNEDFMGAAVYFYSCYRVGNYFISEYDEEKLDNSNKLQDDEDINIVKKMTSLYLFNYAVSLYEQAKNLSQNRDDADIDEDISNVILIMKKEVMDILERVPEGDKDFYQANFYLGYIYWNQGQYIKARICFEKFLKDLDYLKDVIDINENRMVRKEREAQRLDAIDALEFLDESSKIEEGINMVIVGKYVEGIDRLEQYIDKPNVKDWWPIYFYMAVAYEETGFTDASINYYKKVMRLNASNHKTIEGLIRCYTRLQNEEMIKKYKKKLEILDAQDDD